jgi:IMP dehydrogenase
MGSKEARASAYILDRYIEQSRSLPEGVSDYVAYVGDVAGVVETLREGLTSGMIYAGAKNIEEMKKVKMGVVTAIGQTEQRTHDLLGKY